MNKYIVLALLLIISPLSAMEETEQEFLNSLDAFEKKLLQEIEITTPLALKILKNNNSITPQATQSKSKAFDFLFTFNSPQVDTMKLIRATQNGLVFKGDCKDSLTRDGEDFKVIEEGNFSIDYDEIPIHPGPRLIIGRTTVPTLQEYSHMDR